ncbi:MAG TPA: NOL1/NOP2/sun family putative RNA methylase [Candidatus Nanoarchaeia archaeon]|nr:NOL1/NOP2/sun family putative RNA methylase [Candidatus Nanoarchaeia archaeon]
MVNLRTKEFSELAKPIFIERMNELLTDKNDLKEFEKIALEHPVNSIRCNTLKISPDELKKRLELRWKIKQPFKEYPEIMIIENNLEPGEIGRALEHSLGYYYVQEISSMLPLLTLKPSKDDIFLDVCASPGSKTTQAAAMMENKGVLIANDVSIPRIMILSANTQRCGLTNSLITREDGVNLCRKFEKMNFKFDKILLDAPCSCEGTTRSSPKVLSMISENLIKTLCGNQKRLFEASISVLKTGGEIVYSTCTYAPEENEEVVSYILEKYNFKLEEIKLPLKTRPGITKWRDKEFNSEVKKCVRVYPQDNNTEGFFIAKLKKLS